MTRTTAFPGTVDAATIAARYGEPSETVRRKRIGALDLGCRAFIAASPFVLLATAGADGSVDVSPRGGAAGFVRVLDAHRLVIPDAPGNRLVDSLSNIAATGSAGLLFLVPGRGETLRVNGTAVISDDPGLCGAVAEPGRPAPPFVVGVEVVEAYVHCAKAFLRSGLWDPARWGDAAGVPTGAALLAAHLALAEDAVQRSLDDAYARSVRWGDEGAPPT